MTRSSRRALALALVAPGALALPPAAPAAQLVTEPCARVLVTGGVSRPVVPVAGSGFSPNAEVRLRWSEGTTRTVTVGPGGAFGDGGRLRIPGPSRIRRFGVRPVTLTATDTADPGVTARVSTRAVRFEVGLPRGIRPGRRVLYRLFGFPTNRVAYAHVGFGGRIRASHRLGTPGGRCGLLRARRPLLPPRAATGVWRVSVSLGPRLTRRTLVYRVAYRVRRVVVPRGR